MSGCLCGLLATAAVAQRADERTDEAQSAPTQTDAAREEAPDGDANASPPLDTDLPPIAERIRAGVRDNDNTI